MATTQDVHRRAAQLVYDTATVPDDWMAADLRRLLFAEFGRALVYAAADELRPALHADRPGAWTGFYPQTEG